MRIGIEVQRLFRKKKHGMELAALELMRKIQEIDKQNEYILFAKKGEDDQCIQRTSNFDIQTLTSYSYADWEQLRLPVAVKYEKVDFLHSTCNSAPVLCPVPLILTLHDIIFLEKVDFKGTSYQNFGNLYRRFVVPKIVNKSLLIITVSDYEKQVIAERLKLPNDKIKVIYNGLHDRFKTTYPPEEVNEFRKRYMLPENFILFLGNTAPKKNTTTVIRAYVEYCNRVKDSLPFVILDYEKEFVAHTLKQMNALGCLDRIIFPGYIPVDQMPLAYHAASLFLYPSLRESFGMPILESMGSGTPVITSNTSSMPEVAGDAAMLVNPYEFKTIADAMELLLSDSTKYEHYVAKGIERAREFSWETSALELLKVYKDVGGIS